MAERRTEIRRILVALDASRESEAALEAAVELAAELEAELEGLFIEDVNVVHLAGLPFARQMAYGAARDRAFDTQTVEREFRAVAQRLRRALAATAETRHVTWSFRVVRGGVEEELLSAAIESDLVAIGKSDFPFARGRRLSAAARVVTSRGPRAVLLTEPRRAAAAQRIAVTYDGSACSERALDVAARLARAGRRVLDVFVLAKNPEAEHELTEAASRRLAGSGAKLRFTALPAGDVGTLRSVLAHEASALLVLGSACYPLPEDELERLLGESGCPVLFIRDDD